MAMFLYYNRVLVILLIKYLLILCENDFLLTTGKTTVNADGNSVIAGPFLQIEKRTITKLLITKPHFVYTLPCIATIEENYYDQINSLSTDDTNYFYTWYRNDQVLEPYTRRSDFKVYRNGTLRLPSLEKAAGVYRCQINANITAVLSEAVTVEYAVLKRTPAVANISASEGQPLTFDCPVLSVPPANVSWFYGNVSVSKSFEDNRYLMLANGSFVLRKLTPRDAGKYKCLAQNRYAAKTHRQFMWSLTVEPRHGRTAPNANALIPPLQNSTQYVSEGADLKLRCYGLTDAVPIEWWYQNGRFAAPLKLANQSNEYSIQNASYRQHEGYYTCLTPYANQTFHVIVTIPPQIDEPLKSYEISITASLKLQCNANGNPRPAVAWYHNGAPLNSSYTRYISGNALHIHSFDPNEAGIYQCFARNIAGEAYSVAELRSRNRGDEMLPNPLEHIRCYAHSFNTINITFDSKAMESLFIVYIVQNNPHRWVSPFAPMKLNRTSYVVISSHLPVYRPFELITRVLIPTSEIRLANKPQQQTILSSLRSPPVTCCTQGLLLHLVHLGNDTFVTWSQPELEGMKYFILQFSINYTQPHPQQLLGQTLRGTTQHVALTHQDVTQKLRNIAALNETAARAVLKAAGASRMDNEAQPSHLEMAEDIFSMIVPANVTGVLLQNFSRIKMRVLIITHENEHLAQDFRYVQWKVIENDTSEVANTPFRLSIVESRMLVFHFLDTFNDTCVNVCHWQIQFPIIKKEEPKCDKQTIVDSQVTIRSLKPTERYRVNFFSCESQTFYGQLDVRTLPDPPGTISNHRIIRHNGLKLIWDPPEQPNGKIHHYNILWTLGNVTHEANVLDCTACSYKFPNISEIAKINVTIRVVGETGVGAPIFIDLRNINHHTLEVERSSSNSQVYSGIAIGSLLSTLCVICFALLIIFQRRRYKARQQGPTHLTSPSEMNFGNLNNPNIPGDSAGGLSASTFQQDYHEMQTLIPKTGRHIELLAERPKEYQTTQLPNGNGNIGRRQDVTNVELNTSQQSDFDIDGRQNISQQPLCSSTPERPARTAASKQDAPHPFFIPFKQAPPNAVVAAQQRQHSSSANFATTGSSGSASGSGSGGVQPPSTLPLLAAGASQFSVNSSSAGAAGGSNGSAAQRSGSLSNSTGQSNSSRSSSNSSKKQFHTNFPKHSKSNDGICLLADEESAATLTPTSEAGDVHELALTNGFKATAATTTPATTSTQSANTTTTSSIAPTSRSTSVTHPTSSNFKNNTRLKKATTKPEMRGASVAQRLAATPLSNESSIVPAMGPTAAATTSTAAAKHWPTPITATTTTTTTIATASTSAAAAAAASSSAYRRPNVDPNG